MTALACSMGRALAKKLPLFPLEINLGPGDPSIGAASHAAVSVSAAMPRVRTRVAPGCNLGQPA